jgi:hypothetical protein
MQVASMSVMDQHVFADASFKPLLAALPPTPDLGGQDSLQQEEGAMDGPLVCFKLVSEPEAGSDIEVHTHS